MNPSSRSAINHIRVYEEKRMKEERIEDTMKTQELQKIERLSEPDEGSQEIFLSSIIEQLPSQPIHPEQQTHQYDDISSSFHR